jgi:hypothetical protein
VVAEDTDAAGDSDGDELALNCDNEGLIDVLSDADELGCTDADMVRVMETLSL